jgi:hypothetical protein
MGAGGSNVGRLVLRTEADNCLAASCIACLVVSRAEDSLQVALRYTGHHSSIGCPSVRRVWSHR